MSNGHRTLFGSVFLMLLAACGGGGGGGGDDGGGASVSVTLSPASATVSVGATQNFTASVTGSTNTAVNYSVQEADGGSINSSGVYTAPATAGSYHVIATSVADNSKSDSSTVTVVALPQITSFTANASTLTSGDSTTLTAVFAGGTASINGISASISSGVSVPTPALSTDTQYTLTVTNDAGDSVTANLTITVVAAPTISSFTASALAIVDGASTDLTAVFSNGTGVIDQGIGTVSSGVAHASGALLDDTSFTLTVTNTAGTSVTQTLNIVVVNAVPVIASFSSNKNTITLGSSANLSWNVSGEAISTVQIDQGVGTVSNSGSRAVSPSAATTYTLTATNLKGSATATVNIAVVFAPSINSFSASPTTILPNASSTLLPVFSQGSGSINGIGVVTSGNSYGTGNLASAASYTLTVTNAAGDSVTRTLTVHVDPGSYSSTGGTMVSPRHFHTSTLLANGKVLIAGGQNAAYLNSAEEFDPAANAGSGGFNVTASSMGSVRGYPVSVLLPTGKVLILGGIDGSGAHLASAELYDPVTRSFSASAGSLNEARVQSSVTLLANGKVLIVGGNNATTTNISSAEIYDPISDSFSPVSGSLNAARWGHHGSLLSNNRVLIAGGSSGQNTELYDGTLDGFLPTGNSSTIGSWYTLTRLQTGAVLLALSGSGGANATLYDEASGTGSSTTGTPGLARYSAPTATLLADGRVLLAGNAGAPGAEVSADSEYYDPSNGSFSYTANPGNRGQQTAHLLQSGKVLLAGGFDYSGGGILNTAVLFDAGPATAAPAPNATITAPSSTTAGSSGLNASVASGGARYYWLISGGSITSGQGTNNIVFSAGPAGTLTLHCLVYSTANIPGQSSVTITVN